MFTDDYLIRMIRQHAAVWARILGLQKVGDYQDALKEIDQTLEQLLGMDVKIIKLLDDESLYGILTINDQLDMKRLGFIADLFNKEGEILKLQGKGPESDNCYFRSLSFYLLMIMNGEPSQQIEISQKVEEIIQNVKYSDLPDKTLLNLFCYYENEGKYAKADDVLTNLANRPKVRADARSEMISFYERLLEKNFTELSANGMNRQIIQNKLKGLK